MPSPFPGMDPFIEPNPRWKSFHGWFIRELARQTMPAAQALGCWIDVDRSIYGRDSSGEIVMLGEPDNIVAESSIPLWQDHSGTNGGIAVATPMAVHEAVFDPEDPEAIKQEYLVVREMQEHQRVLGVVELLSPANKSGDYAEKYREKRNRFLHARASFMEIDFLRRGYNPARDLFPELPRTPYFIFVARKTGAGRNEEGYPIRLQDPLPVVALPLGAPRPDLPLDLAAAFRAAYDLAVHAGSIRYRDEPVPPPALSEADAAWVRQIVQGSLS